MANVVLSVPAVQDALERAADEETARRFLERLVEAEPGVAHDLETADQVRDALVAVACASRSLATAIVADPSLVDALRAPDLGFERDTSAYRVQALAAVAGGPEDGGRALRRWKRREYLRISARDLLGLAELDVVGRELAGLAAACLGAAVQLAAPDIAFTVVGMGKLGGWELNYASDVDVLFVHDGDADEADRAARAVLSIMTETTADGIVFRTDADLRPEGRAGPLSRTLESYDAWYGRWALNWEFQALIKALPVAGDTALGDAFMALSRQYVWRNVLDPDAVREVRAMKARAEEETRRKGLTDRELKRGPGGIRDIEFAVQLLQLVHGRHDSSIRSRNTLEALDQLSGGGYVEAPDAVRLADAYRFLRTVEHRLQLWDERQTHTLPTDTDALTRLARVLGYRDQPHRTALESYAEEQRAHQAAVRSIHEQLFFAPLLDTLAGTGILPPEAAEERLGAFGFADAAHTRAALLELTQGFSRTSRVMRQLLPVVLDWLSQAPDPDLGLLQLRRLVEGPTRSTMLATTFRESPGAAERACRILGSSRLIGDALVREPSFVEALADDEELREHTADELLATALETLQWRGDVTQRRQGLRRFKRRELLRTAARDLLDLSTLDETGRELAALADACVEAALGMLEPSLPFAVLGMGRLGGNELSYASDIDVLFVFEGETPADALEAERIATELMREIGETTAEGQTFRIDARLRPEGNQGALARSLAGYRAYYERHVQTWELQSLLRARAVAGDRDLTERFRALVEPFVFRNPFPEDDALEIRRVKVRVERERIPPGEDRQFHFKLGAGVLTDIEFTVQLLQLVHGAARPEVRATSTVEGLSSLAAAGILTHEDSAILYEAYRFCERARNARFLVTGRPGDALPTGIHAVRVARLLGYVHRPETTLRDDFRRVTRRARQVVERVFYGRG